MGTFFYYQRQWGEAEATDKLGWLPLVSLMVFFASYSSGYANVPFILMGELLPARYRSILGPVSSSFNLLCTFAVVRGFPAMKDAVGADVTFWIFMTSTFFSLFFVYFFLPETKGKTLEEIERMFSSKTPESSTNSTDIKSAHANPAFTPDDDVKSVSTDSDSDESEDDSVVAAPY